MWIYLGKKIDCSWIRRCPPEDITVNNNSNYDIYITSAYWVITTLTTVGYGDITADLNSLQEILYSTLILIVGMSVYTLVIASLEDIVSQQ